MKRLYMGYSRFKPTMDMVRRYFTLKIMLVATTFSLGFAGISAADVFRSVDELGVVHLTNVPTSQQYQVLLHSPQKSADNRIRSISGSKRQHTIFHNILKKVAREHHLDQALLQAVITVESGFDPNAVSSVGAVGLMQLMPKTAQRYGVSDRTNPEANIQAGASYLHDLMHQFHDDLPLVLAAYNAGEDAVTHYGNHIPPFPETQRYVPRVLNLYRQFRSSVY